MICVDCRTAAKVITEGGMQWEMDLFHAHCRGGTWCDCAHQTTSGLNTQRIRELLEISKRQSENSADASG